MLLRPAPRRVLSTRTIPSPAPRRSSSPPPSPLLLPLSASTLNSYAVSRAPEARDLRAAASVFQRGAPRAVFTTPHFRGVPGSALPEVAFLGRSNVGKSSVLNALFGRPRAAVARVSQRAGKTVTMNGYAVGGRGGDGTGRGGGGVVVVVDMPGYGRASRAEWGVEILKYLRNRRQLRRTYVLVDAEHGLKATDVEVVMELRRSGVAHQVVLSKVDKILFPYAKAPGAETLDRKLRVLRGVQERVRRELDEAAHDAGARAVVTDLLCVSSLKSLDRRNKSRRIGIDELRWSILEACGLQDQDAMKHVKGQGDDDDDDDDDAHHHTVLAASPFAATVAGGDA